MSSVPSNFHFVIFNFLGEKQRKPNLQGQGTTLVASHLVKNEPHHENKENQSTNNQQQTTIKEDFTKANNSQSSENIHDDPFDDSKTAEAPIQNMQREAGDGQIDLEASREDQ